MVRFLNASLQAVRNLAGSGILSKLKRVPFYVSSIVLPCLKGEHLSCFQLFKASLA